MEPFKTFLFAIFIFFQLTQCFSNESKTAKTEKYKIIYLMKKTESLIKFDDLELYKEFSNFADKYEKNYNSTRIILKRFKIFKDNIIFVKNFQQDKRDTAIYGVTKFMDLTYKEFKKQNTGYKLDTKQISKTDKIILRDIKAPKNFDWRTKNVITEVKNQGSCGSCWAFSLTGNIEALYAIKHNKLRSLSEQELIDCDKKDQGCEGGIFESAYNELLRIGGLKTETEYPYVGHDEACQLNKKPITKNDTHIDSYVKLPHDENYMKDWIFQKGPISVGVNAFPLQFYRKGISHPYNFLCSKSMIDHAVLIVGYGVENSKPYWIIKNSWSKNWGENGYYRLYRGYNVCGIAEHPASAILN